MCWRLSAQVTGLNYVCEGEIGDFVLDLRSTDFSSVSNMDSPRVRPPTSAPLQTHLFLRSIPPGCVRDLRTASHPGVAGHPD